MGRSFYVYKSKNGKYTAEFLDPKTGVRMCFRTVAARSYSEAVEIASGWVHSGIPKRCSTIFSSQFDVSGWHTKIPEAALSEAVLDRIVHNSYSVIIGGDESMRKRKAIS